MIQCFTQSNFIGRIGHSDQYQGIKTAEIAKMEVQHIKAKEGKIHVPGSVKGERRILQLEPHQVLDFYDYINTIRKEILSKSGEKTDRLFVGIKAGNSLDGCMTRLMFWLRRKNSLVVNAKQLRASVIVKWLRMYNLREVQYLAGHRYISSTESYQQSDLSLVQAIKAVLHYGMKNEGRISVEQYNREIEAEARVKSGEFFINEEVKKMAKGW